MMKYYCPSVSKAAAVAKTVFHTRYDDASFAYAAGSIMRGQGTYLSDIDLVVIYDRLESARRESFVAEGIPVEAFVHDHGTVAWFIDDDVRRGRPSLLNMIAEGMLIGHSPERGEQLRREVKYRLNEGPLPLSSSTLNTLRYEITDAIDDLRGDRPQDEIMAIGTVLYPKLVEFALRSRDYWNGEGKWAPRLLREADTFLAKKFDEAFRILFESGSADLLTALAEAELSPHSGFLFAGDCRSAPASWRR